MVGWSGCQPRQLRDCQCYANELHRCIVGVRGDYSEFLWARQMSSQWTTALTQSRKREAALSVCCCLSSALCSCAVSLYLNPTKYNNGFPKSKGFFFNLMHGMFVWFLIIIRKTHVPFFFSMFLFISVQLINSSGCHLRMKSGLKPLASVELKWRSTFFLLAQYMWPCRWALPGLQALITFSFFVCLCTWPWKYTAKWCTLR